MHIIHYNDKNDNYVTYGVINNIINGKIIYSNYINSIQILIIIQIVFKIIK